MTNCSLGGLCRGSEPARNFHGYTTSMISGWVCSEDMDKDNEQDEDEDGDEDGIDDDVRIKDKR